MGQNYHEKICKNLTDLRIHMALGTSIKKCGYHHNEKEHFLFKYEYFILIFIVCCFKENIADHIII